MKHENWAVQCPTDYSTNEKWKEILKWLNEGMKTNHKGFLVDDLYGIFNSKIICRSHEDMPHGCQILSIDEAHDMLFGNPVKYTIYQELLLLKFKKVKSKGKIVLDENGSYQMRKQATDHSSFLWNHSNPNLDLIEYWVDGIKVSTMKVDEVKEFLSKIESK